MRRIVLGVLLIATQLLMSIKSINNYNFKTMMTEQIQGTNMSMLEIKINCFQLKILNGVVAGMTAISKRTLLI